MNRKGVPGMDLNPSPRMFCSICGKQVDLRSAQTDAYGKTVHQECHSFLYGVPSSNEPHAA